VVAFSDGQATANERGIEETHEMAIRSGVIISVVGLSDNALRNGSQMQVIGRNDGLRSLARDTGGRYSELRSHQKDPVMLIVDALRDLRGRVRLEFVPPVRDGAIHRVSIMFRGLPVHEPVWLQF
jgi:hypothetical protein